MPDFLHALAYLVTLGVAFTLGYHAATQKAHKPREEAYTARRAHDPSQGVHPPIQPCPVCVASRLEAYKRDALQAYKRPSVIDRYVSIRPVDPHRNN
jgi:hypothetical protein